MDFAWQINKIVILALEKAELSFKEKLSSNIEKADGVILISTYIKFIVENSLAELIETLIALLN